MATKRKAAVVRAVSEEELQNAVEAMVRRAPGLSGADFKKELGKDYKGHEARALEIASELAKAKTLYRWSSAKKERFFVGDPFGELAKAVSDELQGGPLEEAELKGRLEARHRGYGDLLKDWLKGAIQRGDVYPAAPAAAGSKKKRIAREPDAGSLLKKVVSELQKVLATPAGQRVAKQRLLEVLAKELNEEAPSAAPPPVATAMPRVVSSPDQERETFLQELQALAAQNPRNGLLLVSELRARIDLEKQRFDTLALELSRAGLVTLHHHDFPTSLSDSERRELIADGNGTYYLGIASRSSR